MPGQGAGANGVAPAGMSETMTETPCCYFGEPPGNLKGRQRETDNLSRCKFLTRSRQRRRCHGL